MNLIWQSKNCSGDTERKENAPISILLQLIFQIAGTEHNAWPEDGGGNKVGKRGTHVFFTW